MKNYLSVYAEFLRTCFAEATSYRLHFVMIVLLDIFSVATAITGTSFLYDHVETIGPWGKAQLLFFIAYMLHINSIHKCVNSQNFWYLSLYIRRGDLDFILLRPLHSLFTCFFRHFRVASSLNILITLGITIYLGAQLGFTAEQWVLMPIFIFLSWYLLLSIEMLITSSMFWIQEGTGINFLRLQLQELGEWPEYIYKGAMRGFFLFICPILLIGSGPVHFLLEGSAYKFLLGMFLACILVTLVLRTVWAIALRSYNSASS